MAGDVEQNPGPTGILEVKDLVTVQGELQGIASKWKDFGLQLKMIITTLEEIAARYHSDPSDCLRETIKHWLTNTIPSPTWEDIALGLESNIIKEQAMADKIRTKYCSTTDASPGIISHKRKRDVKTISREQGSLTVQFHKAVEAVIDEYVELHGNNVDMLKTFLCCFSHPDDLSQPYIPVTVFANATRVTDVIRSLMPHYINIMHINLLQYIVERFGSEKTDRILLDYKEFSGRCKIRDYPNPVSDEKLGECPCMKKLKLSTSKDYNVATIADVHSIKHGVATATDTDPGLIVPAQHHPGSLTLVFLIPTSTCLALHSLQKNGLETLANCGTLRLEIDDLVIDDIQKYKTELATVSNHSKQYFLSGPEQPCLETRKEPFSTEEEDNLLSIIVKISPEKLSEVCQDVFLLKVSTFITNLTSLSHSLGFSDARKKEISRMSVTRREQSYNLLMEWKSRKQDNATNGALLHCLMLYAPYATMEKTLQLLFGPESTRPVQPGSQWKTILEARRQPFSTEEEDCLLSIIMKISPNKYFEVCSDIFLLKVSIFITNLTNLSQSLGISDIRKKDNITNMGMTRGEQSYKLLMEWKSQKQGNATSVGLLQRLILYAPYTTMEKVINLLCGPKSGIRKAAQREKKLTGVLSKPAAMKIGLKDKLSLCMASRKGQLDVVKYLVDKHQLIRGEDMIAALYFAIDGGRLSVVKYFITDKKCSPMERGFKGTTPLHQASISGHLDVVKYLIDKHNVDPLIKDEYGNTPLHLAAAGGSLSVVKYFIIEKNCSPMEKGYEGRAPLYPASYHGHLRVVKYLINEHRVDPLIRDDYENTPLHLAAAGGSLSIVKYFITKRGCSLMERGLEGTTPLHQACDHGHLDVVKYLINKHHVNPKIQDDNGDIPLHLAAIRGNLLAVKYFITSKYCSPIERGSEGRTPLHRASNGGQLDVVKYLIDECHVDPLIRDEKMNTPLHWAAQGGSLNVVNYFITEKNCSPEERGFGGTTPLHQASGGGHLDVIKYLIDKHNVDPLIRDEQMHTSHHMAAQRGFLKVVKYFITEKGCSPIEKGQFGLSPIDFACMGGHLQVVQFLVEEQFVDPNRYDDNTNTPLHWAALNGHLNVLWYLITKRKCSPFVKGQWGRSLLHSASQGGFLDVVNYLVEEQLLNPLCVDDNDITPLVLALSNHHGDIVQYLSHATLSTQLQFGNIEETHHDHAREQEQHVRVFPHSLKCQ